MKEKKSNNIFSGKFEMDEGPYTTRQQDSYLRIRVSGLWFTVFDYAKKLEGLHFGDNVVVNYWLSDSDFGRTYRIVESVVLADGLDDPLMVLLGGIRDELVKIRVFLEKNRIV